MSFSKNMRDKDNRKSQSVSKETILIVGFGSIGRRHFKNLQALGYENILFYRTGKSTLPIDEIANSRVEYDLTHALAHKPFVTIIANPTALHMPIALAAARAGSHLFIEKPISHTLNTVSQLQKIVAKKKLIAGVGFQFRFHPDLQKIKQQLKQQKIGQIVSVQVHWGEYLPDWHTWEDYKKSYAVRKNLGGGVLLTMSHPFDYLRWLFGDVADVTAVTSQHGGLGVQVEDSADVLMTFLSGVCANVHINFVEKPAEHTLRIIGQKGVLNWKNTKSELVRSAMFMSEMKHFLSCIMQNKHPICTLYDGIQALRISLAAGASAKYKKTIKLV